MISYWCSVHPRQQWNMVQQCVVIKMPLDLTPVPCFEVWVCAESLTNSDNSPAASYEMGNRSGYLYCHHLLSCLPVVVLAGCGRLVGGQRTRHWPLSTSPTGRYWTFLASYLHQQSWQMASDTKNPKNSLACHAIRLPSLICKLFN